MYVIILIILICILLFELYQFIFDKCRKRVRNKRRKKLTKYVESGHNCNDNTVQNYKELEEIIPEDVEENIMKQITMSMIARYNLNRPDITTKHEDKLIETIREFPLMDIGQQQLIEPHLNFIFDRVIPHRLHEIPPLVRDDLDPNPVFHFDPQNVHDSAVNDSVRDMLSKLKTKDCSTPQELDSFIDLKSKEMTVDEKNKLDGVMNKINTNYTDKFNEMSEYEVLQHVHKRCDNVEKQNLLISNLIDAYENGGVVCATGRLNRFVATLELDEEIGKPLVTKEIVRNECFSKAGAIRNKMLEKMSPEFINKYNSNIEDKEVLNFTNNVCNEIRKQLSNDYAHLKNIGLEKIIDETLQF